MSGPLVTIGVPVYRGQDIVASILECLRTQTYQNLDVLISVDGADEASVAACRPFLSDPRFRLHVQPVQLGWAGNTDWTIRNRRGDFYIYQEQDDLVSPSYVGDLVTAASHWPAASICYSEMRISGPQNVTVRDQSLIGEPMARALMHMEKLNTSMLRGLMRGSALNATSGVRNNEFEDFGGEHHLMVELALAGEFRFVRGPTYYKRVHGRNLHAKWRGWPEDRKRAAWACLAAWIVEAIVPAGRDIEDRWRLLHIVLDRFLVARGWLNRLRNRGQRLHTLDLDPRAAPIRAAVDLIRRSGRFDAWLAAHSRYMFFQIDDDDLATRAFLLRAIFDRLRSEGRNELPASLRSNWNSIEEKAARDFRVAR
jgi:glycosyltransferase involved in cell wall biosynthesis